MEELPKNEWSNCTAGKKIDADQMNQTSAWAIMRGMSTQIAENTARPKPPPEEMERHAEEAAHFLKLMANPHRLMILCHLLDSELSVSELNQHLPLSQSALSQHLAVLRHSGLVQTRRQQQVIFYSLASMEVRAVMGELYHQFCKPEGA